MTQEHTTIADLLRRSVDRMTTADRRVARALLNAHPIAGLETVSQLSERAQVSGPTVVRFVKKLGFEGYPQFQKALREEIHGQIGAHPALYRRRSMEGKRADWVSAAFASYARSLEETAATISTREMEQITNLLADLRLRIHCAGGRLSHSLAEYLSVHLRILRGGVSLMSSDAAHRADDLMDMGRRDVLIVFDYRRYQQDSIDLARLAQHRGARVVLITDAWLSPAADFSDHVLTFHSEASTPFDSLVAATGIVESLVGGVVVRLGEIAQDRIKEWDALRAAVHSYDRSGLEIETGQPEAERP